MNRKDILNDNEKISHLIAINHTKEEYEKYKQKIISKPSNIEIQYLETLDELKKISVKTKLS